MKKILVFCILSFFVSLVSAQNGSDTINQLDAKGKKHGYWQKVKNDTLIYTGRFDHGKPVGLFIYYFPDSTIRTSMMHYEGGIARTINYHPNGAVMSVGKYVNRKKDSIWQIFDQWGFHIAREEYDNGLKTGKWEVYYENKQISSVVNYVEGKKHGEYKEFYRDGTKKVTASYKNDKLQGAYVTYYSNGKICIYGYYMQSLAHGDWQFYMINGQLEKKVTYNMGVVTATVYVNGKKEDDLDSEETKKEVKKFQNDLRRQQLE